MGALTSFSFKGHQTSTCSGFQTNFTLFAVSLVSGLAFFLAVMRDVDDGGASNAYVHKMLSSLKSWRRTHASRSVNILTVRLIVPKVPKCAPVTLSIPLYLSILSLMPKLWKCSLAPEKINLVAWYLLYLVTLTSSNKMYFTRTHKQGPHLRKLAANYCRR